MSSWYKEKAPENDIVISSRIRLARNLEKMPFPAKMTPEERRKLNDAVKDAIAGNDDPLLSTLTFISMDDVPQNEIAAMVERHIISPEFAENAAGRALLLSQNESVSVMIGEEDHIRIQVICGGLQPEKAYETAARLDALLCEKLHFAFDSRLGYLTECPTNLGTGLRASVMLHLPVLESNNGISELTNSVAKIGFTVRGMYGEGSKSYASMYQISNQITLGITEQNAIENLKVITMQIVEKERTARENLNRIRLEDICFRALGVLQNCRLCSSEEMMRLLSSCQLGKSMGILTDEIHPVSLLIEGQPHMLMKKYGAADAEERDRYRADFLRESLCKEE